MKINSIKFWIGCIITFVLLFLMNYIGNDETDKIQRSILTGLGGVVGLILGTFIFRNKGSQPPNEFD